MLHKKRATFINIKHVIKKLMERFINTKYKGTLPSEMRKIYIKYLPCKCLNI